MNSQVYIAAGAQHNVTMFDNGRTRNWTGSTAREKKEEEERLRENENLWPNRQERQEV